MKRIFTPQILLFIFLLGKSAFAQVELQSAHKHDHGKAPELLLEEKLPFQSYFKIISEAENSNGINGSEKNYFYKFISPEMKQLRSKALEATTEANLSALLAEFKTAIMQKALTFASEKAVIMDKIDNPLKHRGYNFRAPNPNNEINTAGQPCTNEGFEAGNTSAWEASWGDDDLCISTGIFGICTDYADNDPYGQTGFDLGANNTTTEYHTLCTAGADPNVPALQRVRPGGGTYSIRLNNFTTYDYSAARLIQTFRVTPANVNFTYFYAAVLQDGTTTHSVAEQPFFRIRMYDQNGNNINCAAFDVNGADAAGIGGFITSGAYIYKDWSAVFVPLSAYVNQDVTIEFTTNDCTQGGHIGYAYIDANCQPFQLISQSPQICNGINNILTAPAGAASYTWTTTGGNIVSGGNTNAVTVDQAGSYSVTMTAFGSGCSYTIDTVLTGAPVSPDASFTSTSPCAGSPSVFTDQSTGGVSSWTWDFGDGTATSSAQNPNHTYASAGTYTVTLQATNGCTDTYTTTVTIPAGSTAEFSTTPVCEGNATTFTNTSVAPAGSTFDWTFGDTQTASNTGGDVMHSYAGANTYNVTLTITAPAGCNGTVTHQVVVNANPNPAFVASSVCANSCSQFTNNTPAAPAIATWAWDFTNNGSADDATAAPCFVYTSAGTYTASLTATTTAGCTGSITNTVTVNPNPVASFTASTECVNDATTFDNSASTIAAPDNIAFYNWTFGDGQNASGTNTTHTYAACGTYTANLVLVSNNNCTNTYSTTVNVKCRPTVTVPTNTVVCPATSIAATSFSSNPAGATYDWTNSEAGIGLGASGSNDIASFNSTNTTTSALTGTITVTPSLAGCAGTPSSYEITVNPTPEAPATTDVFYCLNDATSALTATASAGGSLLWWGTDASGGASSATSPVPSSATVGITTYYVSQTVLSCEGPRAPLNVTINTLPSIIDPPDTIVCPAVGVPIRDFTSSPAGATLNWTNTNITTGLSASGSGAVPFFTSANTTSATISSAITVTPTLGTCVGAPITYSVTVNPKPIPGIPADIEACPGSTVNSINFSSTPADAATVYTWVHSNANVGLSAGTTAVVNSASTPTFTATNVNPFAISSTFTLISTLNGCISDPVSFTFKANPLPFPDFVAGHTCEGDATNFASGSSVGTGSIIAHEWDFNSDGTYELTGNTITPSYNLLTAGTHSVTLNVRTDKGCVRDTLIPFYIYPKPVPTIAVDDPNGCADHSVMLSAGVDTSSTDHPNSIVSWEWDVQSNGLADFTHDYPFGSQTDSLPYTYLNNSAVISEFYQVTVTASTDDGCTGSFSTVPTFIEVYANPIADFTYSNDPEPDVEHPLVQFMDQSQGASSWSWQFNDPLSLPGANVSSLQNPSHYYEKYEADTYDVTLIINNGQCWDTITKPVTIKPDWTFYIPNAFTPNDDGINDGFRGTGVGIKEYSLMIFDRWGALIWSSGDLEEYWDGKMKDRIVQQDTYIWKVKFKDGKGFKHGLEGHVSVVR